jgi:hypothetical protein
MGKIKITRTAAVYPIGQVELDENDKNKTYSG